MDEREARIRAKAHEIWLAEGEPLGCDLDHWLQAAALVDRQEVDMPAAGPHANSDLTNADATPGTGMLPDVSSGDPNQQSSG